MPTARDICTLALKEAGVLGVGQNAMAEDINDTFTLLKQMMGQWGKRRWLVPMKVDIAAVADGSISNMIGPGQHYDAPRPAKIEAAYFIQKNNGVNNVSYPLTPIWSYEDYASIALKSLHSFPFAYFYDAAFPYGNVYIYPVPSVNYEVHLIVDGSLGFPTDLDQTLILPDEYQEAIHYNLCVRVTSMYGYPANPIQGVLAKLALNTIKVANTQISELRMPGALMSGGSVNMLAGGGVPATPVNPTPIVITTQTYTIDQLNSLYFVNYPGPVFITMGLAAGRNNLNCIIKDISGHASANHISIATNPLDINKIDGNSPYVINTDFGGVNLQPSTLGYAVIP